MFGFKNVACRRHIDLIFGGDAPRQFEQIFNVGAGDIIFRRRRRHLAHARQLLFSCCAGFVGHFGIVELLAQLVDISVVVLFAKLFLNLPHAITQDAFAMVARRFAFELGADVGFESKHCGAAFE